MVFRRRDRRPLLRTIADFLYPRGGWTRAFHYVKHRVRRLPDSPERIARGIFAGVFTTFTPFYGMHFVVAAIVARTLRGNIFAALMATFFGNPLTYVPIGLVSLKTGYTLLGTRFDEGKHRSFGGKFADAGHDLTNNFLAIFTDRTADWQGLRVFYDEVFFPYMIGGLIPGVIAGCIAYYLSVPVIRAYQKRRRGAIKAKFEAIRKKAAVAEATRKSNAKKAD
ncbi:DUF2062 domain-containing protein [Arenibacterium halophilum]|uniref:DUF2062 domain-containing protein n=1 Tax=Arenibacterium halophilum TaxID=2583821 RepID=A0ABY2XFD7_9RHOB|nr:DUF2062 domain-containing protein [Arenibacterium halophilum]TMV15436.1 DUF2062 domain-containing protein [Arenibacterium halophilum]